MCPVRLALVVTFPAVKEAPVPVMFVPTNADGVPSAGVTSVGEVERTTSPVPVHVKRDEVANAVTFAVAPVLFPRTVFAATCGSCASVRALFAIPIVTAEPPT